MVQMAGFTHLARNPGHCAPALLHHHHATAYHCLLAFRRKRRSALTKSLRPFSAGKLISGALSVSLKAPYCSSDTFHLCFASPAPPVTYSGNDRNRAAASPIGVQVCTWATPRKHLVTQGSGRDPILVRRSHVLHPRRFPGVIPRDQYVIRLQMPVNTVSLEYVQSLACHRLLCAGPAHCFLSIWKGVCIDLMYTPGLGSGRSYIATNSWLLLCRSTVDSPVRVQNSSVFRPQGIFYISEDRLPGAVPEVPFKMSGREDMPQMRGKLSDDSNEWLSGRWCGVARQSTWQPGAH